MSGTSLSSIAFSNSTEVALRKAHPNYFDQHGSPIAAIRRAFMALVTLRVERFPGDAYASLTKLQRLYALPEVMEINVPELTVDSGNSSPTCRRLNTGEREERQKNCSVLGLILLNVQLSPPIIVTESVTRSLLTQWDPRLLHAKTFLTLHEFQLGPHSSIDTIIEHFKLLFILV
jgi:hypothetical protein